MEEKSLLPVREFPDIKPFRHEEVRARVRTHSTIKRLQDGLREANAQIEAQKRAMEQELQDAR